MNLSGNVTYQDPKDLADWLMVQSHGKTYLGCPRQVPPEELGLVPRAPVANIANVADEEGAVTLDPVFEYVTAMQPMQTQAGVQMVPTTSLRTCFGLFTVQRLRVVSYGAVVRIGDLAADERKVIFEMVHDTIEAVQRARAERAGITTAPAGALDALKRATQGRGGNGGLLR